MCTSSCACVFVCVCSYCFEFALARVVSSIEVALFFFKSGILNDQNHCVRFNLRSYLKDHSGFKQRLIKSIS